MRVVVFALASVSILSGISAYADQMAVPALPETGVVAAPSAPAKKLAPLPAEATSTQSTQLLDVQTDPQPTGPPATPTAVTAEPSGVVFMATGLLGVGGLLWRRRSLIR